MNRNYLSFKYTLIILNKKVTIIVNITLNHYFCSHMSTARPWPHLIFSLCSNMVVNLPLSPHFVSGLVDAIKNIRKYFKKYMRQAVWKEMPQKKWQKLRRLGGREEGNLLLKLIFSQAADTDGISVCFVIHFRKKFIVIQYFTFDLKYIIFCISMDSKKDKYL